MDTRIEKTVEALQKRAFRAYACENREEAIELALSLLTDDCSITWGGSMTIRDMGLCDAVKRGPYRVYDRDLIAPSERGAFVKEHFFSDWFFMSTNAITEDGELFNLDGGGNRVASLIFGPKNVLIVAGVNKIVSNADDAIERVRKTAAPKNAQRFDIQTPCKKTGSCADCLSPDTICCSLVRTRFCRPANRVHVILVNEELGY